LLKEEGEVETNKSEETKDNVTEKDRRAITDRK